MFHREKRRTQSGLPRESASESSGLLMALEAPRPGISREYCGTGLLEAHHRAGSVSSQLPLNQERPPVFSFPLQLVLLAVLTDLALRTEGCHKYGSSKGCQGLLDSGAVLAFSPQECAGRMRR